MSEDILFSETQRFKQWWVWLIIIIVNGLVLADFVGVLSSNSNRAADLSGLAISILISAMIFAIRLDTTIKEDGIYVRFFPFTGLKRYAWNELAQLQIRQYNALTEYGGWGLRFGIFGSGKAYTISGNQGIQLIFSNGSKLLVGTANPGDAAEALRRAGLG